MILVLISHTSSEVKARPSAPAKMTGATPFLLTDTEVLMEEKIEISSPVHIAPGSRERVALELLQMIVKSPEIPSPKSQEEYLRLYKKCFRAVCNQQMEYVLRDD